MIQRRSFLAGLAGICAYRKAPAFVREVMPLRSWEWEKTASGLMVKKERAIAQPDDLPRLLIMGAGGLILADVPMVAEPAKGGVISLKNPEITVAHRSGTVSYARLVAPGVCDLPVAFQRDHAICTGQSVQVDISLSHDQIFRGGSLDYSSALKASMMEEFAKRLVRK